MLVLARSPKRGATATALQIVATAAVTGREPHTLDGYQARLARSLNGHRACSEPHGRTHPWPRARPEGVLGRFRLYGGVPFQWLGGGQNCVKAALRASSRQTRAKGSVTTGSTGTSTDPSSRGPKAVRT
jgi:hypothetical protein